MSRTAATRVVLLFVSILPLTVAAASSFGQSPQPVGVEVQVNTYATSAQKVPEVAKDADGDFVVVWGSYTQDGGSYGIFGRRFTSTGVAAGAPFPVNAFTLGAQRVAAVATDSAGAFVVTWSSNGQDGGNYGIFARRFNSSGGAIGLDFQATLATIGNQAAPAIAMTPAGGFVVGWQAENNQDGSSQGVFARRFNAAGSPLGGEIQVNTYITGNQFRPSIAIENDGDFVVAWQSNDQDGNAGGVFLRRFTSAGAPKAGEMQASTYTNSAQRNAFVDGDADGDFVVTWDTQGQDGSGYAIFARRFNSNGTALATEFQVNTYTTGEQRRPQIEVDDSGDFVVAWLSLDQDGSGYGVFAKRFGANGTAVATEFRVNTYVTGAQEYQSIAADADGDFVVAWESDGQNAGNDEIFIQSYAIHAVFDIDGNGDVDPLTDGILALRFMFGFTGTPLTAGAIGDGCTRCDATAVATYMQTLV